MKLLKSAVLATASLSMSAMAVPLSQISDNIDFGIQYRVMYNNSNIQSNKQYDFFRQRLRLSLNVKTEEGVGGFLQLEYRKRFGQSGAFNRLDARGVRYGYLYFPVGPGTVLAGVLPANDEVDQMLFSSDWDLNVGGIAYAGKVSEVSYRLAYVRLVETNNVNTYGDKDQHFLVADFDGNLGVAKAGLHYYGTYGKLGDANTKLNQTWIGPHIDFDAGIAKIHGVLLYNTGKIASTSTKGWLGRLEAKGDLGPTKVGLLGIYSSGKGDVTNPKGFQTVHGLLGTQGYWQYVWLFAPQGPSDVNNIGRGGIGIEPGNLGYGLTTLQAKVDIPITTGVTGTVAAAWFRSNKDMPAPGGGTSKDLGTEIGGQLTVNLGRYMNLDVGYAYAFLGDAAKQNYNAPSTKDNANALFARLQLEF